MAFPMPGKGFNLMIFSLKPPFAEDNDWRNRSEFLQGCAAVLAFLKRKWTVELGYRLKKELFAFADNRIGVRFRYEYKIATGETFRAHGPEQWVFAEDGRMQTRPASINDVPTSPYARLLPFIKGATA